MAHAKPSNGASLRAALAIFFGKLTLFTGIDYLQSGGATHLKYVVTIRNISMEIDETGGFGSREASAVGDACSTEGSSNASIR